MMTTRLKEVERHHEDDRNFMKEIETSVKIRPMRLDDIEQAMRLKNLEDWNQTKQDWEILLKHSPETCLVAFSDQKVIGTVTAINYSNELAWIGMILVAPKHRRKGIGSLLLKNNLNRLKNCNNVGLDATPLGREIYSRLGFIEEVTISRMTISSIPKQPMTGRRTSITPMGLYDIQEIANLDKVVSGANRANLFELIHKKYPEKGLKLKKDGQITGYCLRRNGAKYNHLGPVVAFTIEDAKTLLSAAMALLAGRSAVIDVPQTKPELLKWLTSLGFEEQRSLIRMYYKNNNILKQTGKEYAICGPEFG